jgi:hypothetical protein
MSRHCVRNLAVPFFSQRENKYVWQQKKMDNSPKPNTERSLAWTSCNITSLCMILHYFGVTKDSPDDMMEKIFTSHLEPFSSWQKDEEGYNAFEKAENMKHIVEVLYPMSGATIETKDPNAKVNLDYVSRQIEKNYPVWFSYGPIKNAQWGSGHIAVIRGFTEKGDIIINDPWGAPSNPFGHLQTQNNREIIRTVNPGRFYSLDERENENNKHMGMGTGDNCIIRQSDFLGILRKNGTETYFNQTLVIQYNHYWAFPSRGEGGEILRMSDPGRGSTQEDRNLFAEEQIRKMKGFVEGSIDSFPVSSLGMPHYGEPLEHHEELPLYSIGPGRLIAAMILPPEIRFDRTKTPCFVLIQHHCTIGGNAAPQEFFSLYRHLRPFSVIEVNEMIKRRMAFSSGAGGTVKEIDWLEQIIDHIMPKRAIIKDKAGNTENPLTGEITGNTPVIMFKNSQGRIVDTDPKEHLPERGLIYLCPAIDSTGNQAESELEKMVKSIELNLENEEHLSELFKKINDNNVYVETVRQNNVDMHYYRFFYYNKTTSSMETRYVKKDNRVIPQQVNIKEYVYYRKKLSDLMRGGTVSFLGEDSEITRSTAAAGQKKEDRINVFDRTLRAEIFTQEEYANIFPAGQSIINIQAAINKIDEYYKLHNLSHNDLLKKYLTLSAKLLLTNHNDVTLPFYIEHRREDNDAWNNQLLDSLKKAVNNFFEAKKEEITIEMEQRDATESASEIVKQITGHQNIKVNPANSKWIINGNPKKYKEAFYFAIQKVFPDIAFNGGENYYLGHYDTIFSFYKNNIDKYDDFEFYKYEVYGKFGTLLDLLYKWDGSDTDKFEKRARNGGFQQWYSEMKNSLAKVIGLYEHNRVERIFLDNLYHHHPANLDYYIEVNSNTKIGYMGPCIPSVSDGRRFTAQIEIFSKQNMIKEAENKYDDEKENFVLVTDNTAGPYFDCHKIVDLFIKADIFTGKDFKLLENEVITDKELKKFHLGLFPSASVVFKHKNNFSPFPETAFERSHADSFGFGGVVIERDIALYNDQMWFNEKLAQDFKKASINLSPGDSMFSYHPTGFLIKLSF